MLNMKKSGRISARSAGTKSSGTMKKEYCPFCGEELGSIVRPKKKETGSGGAGGVIFLLAVIVIVIMLLKQG